MSRPVSVALATYNGEKYLEAQIESILTQTYQNIEIVIVDDGSTDGTWALAQRLASKDSRIKIQLNEKTLGLVLNFMKAVSLCRGEYVVYSDQDDLWEDQRISLLKGLIDADPKNMLAYSDLEIYGEDLFVPQGSFWKKSGIRPFSGSLGERALLKNLTPGCTMMFRKPVAVMIAECYQSADFRTLNSAKVLDETPFMHDHLAQVIASGLGRLVYTPKKLVRYRQHASNSIGAFYKARDSREEFVRCLLARIEALRPFREKLTGINWEKMEKFARRYKVSNRNPMPEFLPFFLFLRNHALKDRLLGGVDCLFPSFYKKAQAYAKPH